MTFKQRIGNAWKAITGRLWEGPQGIYGGPWQRSGLSIATADTALAISPFWAAIRLFQTQVSSLPMITYRKDSEGGRTRATSHPAYRLLSERPNPAQSRSTFFAYAIKEMYEHGDMFIQIRWRGNKNLFGLYPVPSSSVSEIYVDSEWNKSYRVNDELIPDEDMIHCFLYSCDGIRGVPILRYGAESMGLHRQVLESANAYYKNAANPKSYVKITGPMDNQSREQLEKEWATNYGGTLNTGKTPFLKNAEIEAFPTDTATDAKIIEAMGASVSDIARWFGVSPSDIGDRENTKYNSLDADNESFYQRSLRPVLDMIELEFNAKLFGPNSEIYCEFLTQAMLKGTPKQEQEVINGYIQSGVLLRSEAREMLNCDPIPGLDTPLAPTNQAVITGAADAKPLIPQSKDANGTQNQDQQLSA